MDTTTSTNNPQLLIVRHGPTTANDPSTEAIRGHSDIPLSNEGIEHIKQTAKFLKKSGFPIRRLLCSPLQRSMMTAQIVADELSAKIHPIFYLTPWSLGDLTGKSIKEVAPKMNEFQHHPDIKVPNGESYRDFYNRWTDGLERMLQFAEENLDQMLVGITHSRNVLALPSILGTRQIGDVPVKGGPAPGAVIRLHKIDDDWKYQVIFEQKL